MIVRGDHIQLRLPVISDAPTLMKWENDQDIVSSGGSGNEIFDIVHLTRFIQSGNDFYSSGQLRLVIADHFSRALGTLDLFNYDKSSGSCELGILIAQPSDRNRGYATETIVISFKYARDTLGIKMFRVKVANDNIQSKKLFEKTGFTIEKRGPNVNCYTRIL